MPYAAWLTVGALTGLLARQTLRDRFPLLFRLQQSLLASPMAVVAGWSVVVETSFVTTLVVVALAEWATLAVVRARQGDALLASAAHANAGFWAMPATSAMAPEALPLAVVNGLLGVLRGAPALAWFRQSSPTEQSRSTGFVDFAPATLFVAAFALGRVVEAPGWTDDVLVTFSRFLGVYGAFLVAAALPNRPPNRRAWIRGLQALPIRFIGPAVAYAALLRLGVPLSPLVWVLAFAPVPLNSLVLARAFELDHEVASTQLVLTTTVALLALPVVDLLVTGAATP